jgi:hypothetical protein
MKCHHAYVTRQRAFTSILQLPMLNRNMSRNRHIDTFQSSKIDLMKVTYYRRLLLQEISGTYTEWCCSCSHFTYSHCRHVDSIQKGEFKLIKSYGYYVYQLLIT